jgi:hypothetical protein
MSKIYVMGRMGSDYRKKVDKWLGNVNLNEATAAFNYGLQGQKLRDFMDERQHAKLNDLPIINHVQFGNKFDSVEAVRQAGMSAPMSWKYRDRGEIPEKFFPNNTTLLIQKPYYSLGGKGIERVTNLEDVPGRTHYLQEEIRNRRYELRCIAMAWVPPEQWLFQKRIHDGGEEVLAWNNHNGGKFITVENSNEPLFNRVREDVKKMLPLFNYGFGAVDFIVQNNPGGKLKHFFIEWNLAPGWTMDRTEAWYEPNFLALQNFDQDAIEAFSEGILLAELKEGNRDRAAQYPHRQGRGPALNFDDPPVPPRRMWDELVREYEQEQDGPELRYNVAARVNNNGTPPNYEFMGPVVIRNENVTEILNQEGWDGMYIPSTCPVDMTDLYVRVGTYSYCCPTCGFQMEVQG